MALSVLATALEHGGVPCLDSILLESEDLLADACRRLSPGRGVS